LAATYAFDARDLDRMVFGEGSPSVVGEGVAGRR